MEFLVPDLVNLHEYVFLIMTTKCFYKLLWMRASAKYCKHNKNKQFILDSIIHIFKCTYPCKPYCGTKQ